MRYDGDDDRNQLIAFTVAIIVIVLVGVIISGGSLLIPKDTEIWQASQSNISYSYRVVCDIECEPVLGCDREPVVLIIRSQRQVEVI